MSRSDSVPAPMVQLPAETVEKLREAFDNHDGEPCPVYEAARAVVDAATPAASPTVRADDVTVRAENVIGEGRKPSCEPITTTPESASTPPTTGTAATEAKGTPANTSPRPCARNDQSANAYERAATPAASVPAADILALADHEKSLRELWREAAEKGIEQGVDWPRIVLTLFADIDRLAPLVAAAEQADKGEAADPFTAADLGQLEPDPATPVGGSLPEGWHHIPWTSKEDGVGAPETPASGESGPPAPPALCVGCGHDVGLHNEKGCLHGWAGPEGLCRCRLDGSQVARVPVNDEAEGEAEAWSKWNWGSTPVRGWPDDSVPHLSFMAGFRAGRQEDDRG